jgi:hypothetical protein
MYCTNCGSEIKNTKFCTNCGQPVENASVLKKKVKQVQTKPVEVTSQAPAAAIEAKSGGGESGNTKKFFSGVGSIIVFIIAYAIVRGLFSSGGTSTTPPPSTNNTSNAVVNNNQWQSFNAAEGSFKALLPVYPVRNSSSDVNDAGIRVTSVTYTSTVSSNLVYYIVVDTFAEPIDISNPDAALEKGLNGMLATDVNNVLVSSNYGYYGYDRVLNFIIRNNDVYIKGRILLHGEVVYAFYEAYTINNYVDADYNKFINSFVLP